MSNRMVSVAGSALIVLLTLTGSAFAQSTAPTPEVDSASIATALALLAGSGTLIADAVRRRRKAAR